MALEFIKLVKGDSPVAQVGSFGFFKLGVESSGGGGDFDRVFGNNTPEQISAVSAEISANNMTSAQVAETYGWNIGDTIDITLTTGEAIQMRIIGFNHDDKSDGSGKAGITLEMVNCLNTKYSMDSATSLSGGYTATTMRLITLPTIKTTLPEPLQNIIKSVNKLCANGSKASYTKTITTVEDLFILSETEVCSSSPFPYTEGTLYEYWKNKTDSIRIKYCGTESRSWWLRTPGYSDGQIRYVSRTGTRTNGALNDSSLSVSFAFCV